MIRFIKKRNDWFKNSLMLANLSIRLRFPRHSLPLCAGCGAPMFSLSTSLCPTCEVWVNRPRLAPVPLPPLPASQRLEAK